MKIILFNFITLLSVLFFLFYSVASFGINLLISLAINLQKKGASPSSECLLNYTLTLNLLDPEPYYQMARVFYIKGLKENRIKFLKQALAYFLAAKKLNPYNLSVDLMILETNNLLGASPLKNFDDLKALSEKYPYEMRVEKILIKKGIALWNQLGKKDKDFIMRNIKILLENQYWEIENILPPFIKEIKDFELLKKVIPKNKLIYNYIKSEMPKYELRFDYQWVVETIDELEKLESENLMMNENKMSLQKVKKKWFSKFGNAKAFLSCEQLIGCFHDGSEIVKACLWSNGTIYGVTLLKPDSKNVIIKAKSTSANNIPAYMLVYIDGKILGGVYVENANMNDYSFPLNPINKINKNNALVSVSFVNDFNVKEKSEDRNLYVLSIHID